MSAARRLTNWEAPRPLGISLQKSRAANDNAVQALDDARENSRLGIFVSAHTSLPACEPANDGIAAAKSEAPRRNASEPGITGKEEDVEVGLQYFGKRYLNPLLGRWVSADPLAIHAPGEADLNVYAYVSGSVLKSIDPLGLEDEQVSSGGASSAEESAGAENTSSEGGASYNAPEEGQDAGTGQEGAPSNDSVKQGATGVVGTDAGAVAIGLMCPVCGLGMLVAGGALAATKDTPIAPGTAEAAEANAQGQFSTTMLSMASGGAASKAVTANAARQVGQRTANSTPGQLAARQLDEIGESVVQGLEQSAEASTALVKRSFDNFAPDGGFLGGFRDRTTLPVGQMIDRFGGRGGSYAAPHGTPFAARGLPPENVALPYERFVVLKPLPVDAGIAAHAFGGGGGVQYDLLQSIQSLIDAKYIGVVQ
jgi:RHS repeat-associated protein